MVISPSDDPLRPLFDFIVGDRAKPRPGFEAVEARRPVPAGVVTKVEPFGLGQLVYINGEARPFYANYLQLDEEDESALAACEIKQVRQGGRI